MKENLEATIYNLLNAKIHLIADNSNVIKNIIKIGNFYNSSYGAELKNSKEVIAVLDEMVKTYLRFEPHYIFNFEKGTKQFDGKYEIRFKRNVSNAIISKIAELAAKVQKKQDVLEEMEKAQIGKENDYKIYEKLNSLEI